MKKILALGLLVLSTSAAFADSGAKISDEVAIARGCAQFVSNSVPLERVEDASISDSGTTLTVTLKYKDHGDANCTSWAWLTHDGQKTVCDECSGPIPPGAPNCGCLSSVCSVPEGKPFYKYVTVK